MTMEPTIAPPPTDSAARPTRPARTAARGFTLLEMVAVVAIIGILMGLIGTQILGRVGEARKTAAEAQMTQLVQSLELYRLDNGRYPTTEQGLEALVTAPTTPPEPRRYPVDGYVKERKKLLDTWSNPFQYESPGQHNPRGFDIWSLGADGQAGGDDLDADFGNWEDDAAGN